MNFIIPVAVFAVLGSISGILLTVVSKIFAVKTDDRIEKINESLPQANCGACGFAGCEDYANAIVSSNAPTNLCRLGGADVVKKVSDIMGTKAEVQEAVVSVMHCNGNCNVTSKKFDFEGIDSCAGADMFYGGNGLCSYGCIGLGDCVKVCEGDCISIKNGIADVDESKCIACGKCVKVCPHGLFSLRPVSKFVDVRCSSEDNGKTTRSICQNGCIACKMCEKKCPHDAIHVVGFHAVTDYSKCTNCGECYKICPTGTITIYGRNKKETDG